MTDPHDAKWRRPDKKGESFWSTNFGWIFGRDRDKDDVELEYVKIEKLPGMGRWRMTWRRDPVTPWHVAPEKFVSGSAQTILDDAIALNAQLKAKYDADQKANEARERKRRRERQQQNMEDHERQTGEDHTSGHWSQCPVCNPKKNQ